MKNILLQLVLVVLVVCVGACAKPPGINTSTDAVLPDKQEPNVRVKLGRKKIISLPMEKYLAGVIGHEMSPRWPVEALKAQTIAARSYALFRIKQNRSKGRDWDVLATQADQVFREISANNSHLLGIVDQTRGQVLMNGSEPLEAFFSSTCGGKTENPVQAGLCPTYPIKSTSKDPHCASSPFSNWSLSYSLSEIERLMNRKGYPVHSLREIRIAKRNSSGYVHSVKYIADSGNGTLTGKQFRWMIGSMTMKSLNCDIDQEGDAVIIHGAGFGHGVGLCQYGAKNMAIKNLPFKKILAKYYPKIPIKKLW